MVIPEQVTIDGATYKVTSIGTKAFYRNKTLKSVVVGSNVNKIGGKAFYGCASLQHVIIKSSKFNMGSIGTKVF